MIAVELEHCIQHGDRGLRPVEAISCLRTQERREHTIAMAQILMEEQHRGQRRGEVIYLWFLQLELICIRSDATKDLLRLAPLLQFLKCRASPVRHVGDGEHAHLLEVACLPGCASPPALCLGRIAGGRMREPKRKFDITLIGEKVARLAERLRRIERRLKMADRFRRLTGCDCATR